MRSEPRRTVTARLTTLIRSGDLPVRLVAVLSRQTSSFHLVQANCAFSAPPRGERRGTLIPISQRLTVLTLPQGPNQQQLSIWGISLWLELRVLCCLCQGCALELEACHYLYSYLISSLAWPGLSENQSFPADSSVFHPLHTTTPPPPTPPQTSPPIRSSFQQRCHSCGLYKHNL